MLAFPGSDVIPEPVASVLSPAYVYKNKSGIYLNTQVICCSKTNTNTTSMKICNIQRHKPFHDTASLSAKTVQLLERPLIEHHCSTKVNQIGYNKQLFTLKRMFLKRHDDKP